MTLRTFRDEAHACRTWLNCRTKSKGDGLGRSTSPIDIEATLRMIERAIVTLPAAWRGVTVVNAGWRVGVDRLKEAAPDDGGMPWLERADLPWTWRGWPAGLDASSLRLRRQQLRAALVTVEIVERGRREDVAPVLVVSRTEEERMEKPLVGWKAIALALGVSERTAQAWADEDGLPVRRGTGKRRQVIAMPARLQAWCEERVVANSPVREERA
jgi:hypothetical protein